MLDEVSDSRFWGVNIHLHDGTKESVVVQSCKTKTAEYIKSTLMSVHPEYEDLFVTPVERPSYLSRCYGDPEEF